MSGLLYVTQQYSSTNNPYLQGFFIDILQERGKSVMYVFRAWVTTRDGYRIYAKDYGKRAFRFWVGKR